ncbi:hypothetical protein RFI_25592, partial [Reticulomyxa filosa]
CRSTLYAFALNVSHYEFELMNRLYIFNAVKILLEASKLSPKSSAAKDDNERIDLYLVRIYVMILGQLEKDIPSKTRRTKPLDFASYELNKRLRHEESSTTNDEVDLNEQPSLSHNTYTELDLFSVNTNCICNYFLSAKLYSNELVSICTKEMITSRYLIHKSLRSWQTIIGSSVEKSIGYLIHYSKDQTDLLNAINQTPVHFICHFTSYVNVVDIPFIKFNAFMHLNIILLNVDMLQLLVRLFDTNTPKILTKIAFTRIHKWCKLPSAVFRNHILMNGLISIEHTISLNINVKKPSPEFFTEFFSLKKHLEKQHQGLTGFSESTKGN